MYVRCRTTWYRQSTAENTQTARLAHDDRLRAARPLLERVDRKRVPRDPPPSLQSRPRKIELLWQEGINRRAGHRLVDIEPDAIAASYDGGRGRMREGALSDSVTR